MTPAPPLLIVTLTVRDVGSALEEIARARSAGADLAEVRLDRFAPEEIHRLSGLFPSVLPLLATLRSRAEGGEGPEDPLRRRAILDEVTALPFAFVDREMRRDLGPDAQPRPKAPGPGPQPSEVRSVHLSRLEGREELARWLRTPPGDAVFVKVVVPATLSELWETVLPALPPPGERSIVLHTTGPSGPLLRALAADLGWTAVYCAPPESGGDRSSVRTAVEASQIPVDRLRRHLRPDGGTHPRFALVGHPVAHSRSPALHSRWMAERGKGGLYVALDVLSESELVSSLPKLAGLGFRGLNVTHPWKETSLALATVASSAAERCGCANTLTLEGGEVAADNTDLAAILRRLEELRRAGTWDGTDLLVVGSGGAARAALAAAQEIGARASLLARNLEKAKGLGARFGAEVPTAPPRAPYGLVVHATTAGRVGAEALSVDLRPWVGAGTHLLDFVHRPDDPFLARLAQSVDASYEDGGRLLAYQAAESFEIWWETPVPPESVERAIEELL